MKQKYFAHETAVIDENCQIGEGTKIWHFSHIMTGCVIGDELQYRSECSDLSGGRLGKQCKSAE